MKVDGLNELLYDIHRIKDKKELHLKVVEYITEVKGEQKPFIDTFYLVNYTEDGINEFLYDLDRIKEPDQIYEKMIEYVFPPFTAICHKFYDQQGIKFEIGKTYKCSVWIFGFMNRFMTHLIGNDPDLAFNIRNDWFKEYFRAEVIF